MGTDHMFELHDFEEEKRIITKPFICRFDFEEHIFSICPNSPPQGWVGNVRCAEPI